MFYIFIFLAYAFFSFMGYMANIKGARYFIKNVGIVWKYYPKQYTIPPFWVRKQLKIKRKEILKYCCFQVYVANGYIILLFINSLIFTLSGFNYYIGLILFYILIGILGIDNIIYLFLLVYLGKEKK